MSRTRLKKAIAISILFGMLLVYELIVKAICISQGYCDAYDNTVIVALISAIGGTGVSYAVSETIRPSKYDEG